MENLTNQVTLGGTITKVYPIRYTPMRVAVSSFVVEHQSRQVEAASACAVKCRVYCVMLGMNEDEVSQLVNKLVTVSGFLSQNVKQQLVLHVVNLSIIAQPI